MASNQANLTQVPPQYLTNAKVVNGDFTKLGDRLIDHIVGALIDLERRLRYRIHFVVVMQNMCREFVGASDAPAVIELASACQELGNCLVQDIDEAYLEVEHRLEQTITKTMAAFIRFLEPQMKKYTKRCFTIINGIPGSGLPDNAARMDKLRRDHRQFYQSLITLKLEKVNQRCVVFANHALTHHQFSPAPPDDPYRYYHRYSVAIDDAIIRVNHWLNGKLDRMTADTMASGMAVYDRVFGQPPPPSHSD